MSGDLIVFATLPTRVLAAVAARLTDTTTRSETPVRLHGDEFAIWLGRTTTDHAEHRAAEITAALAGPLWIDGHRITAAGSVGVALTPARAPLGELLRQADQRMYQAKATRHLTTLPTTSRHVRDLRPPRTAA